LGNVTGGNDTITGGSDGATNYLYGDGNQLVSGGAYVAKGGDDLLIAGDNATNYMYGDALGVGSTSQATTGGDDTLVSGTGNDEMWGDVASNVGTVKITGGADVFVFLQSSGDDIIHDFEDGKDLIDVSDYPFTDFSEMYFDTNTNILYFGADDTAANSVTLDGFVGTLDNADFIFASP